ncbi:Na+/H+ antiporter NhaC family protein [Vibrio gallaecicus]|nr:Na+/H+ antiporter NhaC family protein [Vibrio gallaecicus]MDN3617826.1 Na+/H+ antiporter NhaC family protein [Vibrio gallaecicus]
MSTETKTINKKHIIVAAIGIVAALTVQLSTGSMIIGALAGFMVFTFGGVIAWKETQDVFTKGVSHDGNDRLHHDRSRWFRCSDETNWWC